MLTELMKACANPNCPVGLQPVENFYLQKRRVGMARRNLCKLCHNADVRLDRFADKPTGKLKMCIICKVAQDESRFRRTGYGKRRARCKACERAKAVERETRSYSVALPSLVRDADNSGLNVLRETRACDAMARYFGW